MNKQAGEGYRSFLENVDVNGGEYTHVLEGRTYRFDVVTMRWKDVKRNTFAPIETENRLYACFGTNKDEFSKGMLLETDRMRSRLYDPKTNLQRISKLNDFIVSKEMVESVAEGKIDPKKLCVQMAAENPGLIRAYGKENRIEGLASDIQNLKGMYWELAAKMTSIGVSL